MMNTYFNPTNRIIQLCIAGMGMEDGGRPDEASKLFESAWREAENDFEKFIAAYYVARHQESISERLSWLETSLACALKIDDVNVQSAYPALYTSIAKCYEALGDAKHAKLNDEKADAYRVAPSDSGPFFHGTKADLQVGSMLTAGGESNYKADLKMNHIYFTANINGAGLAAALAKGEGSERVYVVEPTGAYEDDPNVTDKKFPGNLTRSYRSKEPLRIIGEIIDWKKQTPEELLRWREKLAKNTGEIIN